MNEIQINLLPSSKFGRLYYQKDPENELDILFLQNNLKLKRTYSINIDSGIILDLNENRILQAAEFVINRRVWKINPLLELPHPTTEVDIQIVNQLNRNEIMETPVRSIADNGYRSVSFDWGAEDNNKQWVYLSEQCYASISGVYLTGFFIRLI